MPIAFVWLLAAIVCSCIANLLLKEASQGSGLAAYFSVPFLGGAFILGLGLLGYLRALHTIPISAAYPMMVGSTMVMTMIGANWLFQERITLGQVAGAALILGGIILLVQRGTAA